MLKLWGKLWKDNRMLCDTVFEETGSDTRTHKVFHGLDAICREFDLSKPIWLNKTVSDFQQYGMARFYQDSFIEEINFDYLELQIIEEG